MNLTRKLERERQILRLLAQGWGPARVGRHFGISDSRVCYIRDRALWESGSRYIANLRAGEPSISFPPLTVREG